MEIRAGYKKTEVGVIPEDWEVKRLGDVIKLKNGYAFSSDFFSNSGHIIITPGNFKLDGGLYFNERNTLRYSGNISNEMQFQNGDLLIVMTDLTPDCNLLGKPGIINTEEIILHNQRIGKISVINKLVNKNYLYWFFVSELFSQRMKVTATGSTVRHTSVGSINNSILAIPSLAEQTAIAKALSDADALIASLEKLIAKKRNIKQGAMQKLLQPKDGWEVKRLGEVFDFKQGVQCAIEKQNFNEDIGLKRFIRIVDLTQPNELPRYIHDPGICHHIQKDDLFMVRYGNPGLLGFGYEGVIANNLFRLILKLKYPTHFFFYILSFKNNEIMQLTSSTTMAALNFTSLKNLIISYPKSSEEQTSIATILSDMDNEITALENKLEKYKKIKLGMMQNLLTGKIRLL